MGMQLPPELVTVLGTLGVEWPETDEEKVFDLGSAWREFGGELSGIGGDLDKSAQRVWTDQEGPLVEGFQKLWTDAGGTKTLDQVKDFGSAFGVGLFVYAGVVLALKIAAIVQLVILVVQIAQAIATAVVTFGASLAEIPIFRMATELAIEQLIDLAISKIIGG